jgi:hypothetical protein
MARGGACKLAPNRNESHWCVGGMAARMRSYRMVVVVVDDDDDGTPQLWRRISMVRVFKKCAWGCRKRSDAVCASIKTDGTRNSLNSKASHKPTGPPPTITIGGGGKVVVVVVGNDDDDDDDGGGGGWLGAEKARS